MQIGGATAAGAGISLPHYARGPLGSLLKPRQDAGVFAQTYIILRLRIQYLIIDPTILEKMPALGAAASVCDPEGKLQKKKSLAQNVFVFCAAVLPLVSRLPYYVSRKLTRLEMHNSNYFGTSATLPTCQWLHPPAKTIAAAFGYCDVIFNPETQAASALPWTPRKW